jgi:L-amino acid N-acyltransferase YncA
VRQALWPRDSQDAHRRDMAVFLALLDNEATRCVIGGIARPNDASVALHEKFGMRKVAHFERNGIRWIDVG